MISYALPTLICVVSALPSGSASVASAPHGSTVAVFASPLLAQEDPKIELSPFEQTQQSMRRRLGDESPFFTPWEFVLFALVLLVIVLAGTRIHAMIEKKEKAGPDDTPKVLFKKLLRSHGLNRNECQLLIQIAQTQQLADPARLFLEPDRLIAAAHSPRFANHKREINHLGLVLFSDLDGHSPEMEHEETLEHAE